MEPTRPDVNQFEKPKSKAGVWAAFGVIIVAVIIVLIYFATQKTLKNSTIDPSQNAPITNTPASTPGTSVVAGASERVAVIPTIIGLDVTNLGTFPYKVQARVKAILPDTCAQLDAPTIAVSGKTFTITATASKAKDAVCAQTLTNQEITVDIPVAGAPAGKYTVKLGKFIKTFTLASNNSVEFTGDK